MHTAALSYPLAFDRPATAPADEFLRLARRHQQSAFQIIFGLLRDEIAAETLNRQVFARMRRRLAAGADATTATLWIYHASLRFACRYYWKTATPAMRRRLGEIVRGNQENFDLAGFVRVLAFHPGKIDTHDCELIALRHVLGLPLVQIGQLVRMHPYEISNRLTWSRERVKELRGHSAFAAHAEPHQPQYA